MLGGRLISQHRPGGSCVAVRPVPVPRLGGCATARGAQAALPQPRAQQRGLQLTGKTVPGSTRAGGGVGWVPGGVLAPSSPLLVGFVTRRDVVSPTQG